MSNSLDLSSNCLHAGTFSRIRLLVNYKIKHFKNYFMDTIRVSTSKLFANTITAKELNTEMTGP